jgi:hypothetical protein
MTANDDTRRLRLTPALTALVLGMVVLALLAATIPVASANHIFALHDLPTVVLIVTTTVVGVVVARHLPANPMGWLILGIGVSQILSVEGTVWLTLDYGVHHGRLPFGWLALLVQPAWGLTFVFFGLTILLFPDGRLPSRHWRWLLWTYLATAAVYLGGTWEISIAAIAGHHVIVDSSGELASLDHPGSATAWWAAVQNVFLWLLAVSLLAAVGRQLVGFVKSSGERRQQVKWALSGTAVSVTCGFLALSLPDNANPIVSAIGNAAIAGVPALPIGIGVAILRYRLYDIDRIISRTLAYAIVTGLLAGVYAGVVLLATQVLDITSPVAVAGATLVAAALFSPLRARVQRLVDRRFNRARYDADQTVAAFAARLQDAVDPDGVRADLLSVVHRSLEPVHLSVWFPSDGGAARETQQCAAGAPGPAAHVRGFQLRGRPRSWHQPGQGGHHQQQRSHLEHAALEGQAVPMAERAEEQHAGHGDADGVTDLLGRGQRPGHRSGCSGLGVAQHRGGQRGDAQPLPGAEQHQPGEQPGDRAAGPGVRRGQVQGGVAERRGHGPGGDHRPAEPHGQRGSPERGEQVAGGQEGKHPARGQR